MNNHHLDTYRIEQLKSKHKQNSESHNCDVTELDYKRFEPQKELLKRLSLLENSTYTIYDMNKNNYLLKSAEFKRMLGYTKPEDIESDEMEHFHELIHPDDLRFVLETENITYDFFQNLPAKEKKDYKLVYDFRVKNTSGIYMRFIHQFAVLEQDRSGKSWLVLVVTDLISERATSGKPQRRLINLKTGKLHLFNNDDEFCSDKLLTKREIQILDMIAQGLNSKDISEKLFISLSTVNNHRQNILRKTKTENTTQALLYAKRIGII